MNEDYEDIRKSISSIIGSGEVVGQTLYEICEIIKDEYKKSNNEDFEILDYFYETNGRQDEAFESLMSHHDKLKIIANKITNKLMDIEETK